MIVCLRRLLCELCVCFAMMLCLFVYTRWCCIGVGYMFSIVVCLSVKARLCVSIACFVECCRDCLCSQYFVLLVIVLVVLFNVVKFWMLLFHVSYGLVFKR